LVINGGNMITRIREVRRAKGLTLLDVAERCTPPTTAQTIGRLETGTRTVSVGWLNRIAAALEVTAGDLVDFPDHADLPVAAILGTDGAHAPTREAFGAPPLVEPGMVAIQVDCAVGEYRSGDSVWCRRVAPQDFGQLLNRDILVPRPAGRFIFGRCINRDGTMLQILPPGSGGKQQVVADPAWAAYAVKLIRSL
jgi:transcriptional regulator with XRE-family HTH domain